MQPGPAADVLAAPHKRGMRGKGAGWPGLKQMRGGAFSGWLQEVTWKLLHDGGGPCAGFDRAATVAVRLLPMQLDTLVEPMMVGWCSAGSHRGRAGGEDGCPAGMKAHNKLACTRPPAPGNSWVDCWLVQNFGSQALHVAGTKVWISKANASGAGAAGAEA